MTEKRSGGAVARTGTACVLFVVAIASFPGRAGAEKTLVSKDGWEIFTDGRAGGFVSHAYGDGYPQSTYGYAYDAMGNPVLDAMGNPVFVADPVHILQEGGGFRSISEQGVGIPASVTGGEPIADQGTINLTRVRSGFVGNTIGFGARAKLTEWTTVSAYLQFWMFAENDGRQKNLPNVPDARQGYAKLEGLWGSLTVGRTRALFSRGNTDIDAMYAHRWGVGWPGALDNRGPTLGQLSFGVLGVGFSSGIIYNTPVRGGLQLAIGLLDPIQLQGYGNWTRTKYLRPEAELTFEQAIPSGKVVVFANGVYQKVYKDGLPTVIFDPVTMRNLPWEATVAGAGYGARLEVGRYRLGASGYYGQGLGLRYALEVSEAAQDRQGNPRKSSGVHVQGMVILGGKVDVFAGWGIAQIYLTEYDNKAKKPDPRDARVNDPDPLIKAMANQVSPYTVLKYQMGANAGVVYHVTPSLHIDLDFFRAEAGWYGVNTDSSGNPYPGQKQVVWVGNSGLVVNW